MPTKLRSATTTEGDGWQGARSWRANGMREDQIGKPVIAVVNSFTQFVPGHVHLHEIGQHVKKLIEAQGCFAADSIPSRSMMESRWATTECLLAAVENLIADSVEYMVNAHMADAMICIQIATRSHRAC